MRVHKPTSRSLSSGISELDRRIDLLVQKFPELAEDELIRNKEVIKDSEELSKEIIDSLRQRLTP
jgi:hypothetical protein